MDDYKKNVIEMVRDHIFLWNPVHRDYKNKEQRKQAWEDIDVKIRPPTGTDTTAKATWDQLNRGFCNAIKRKQKKSGSGAKNNKDWKFLQEMMFLVPVKITRGTTIDIDAIIQSDEESAISSHEEDTQDQENDVIDVDREAVIEEKTTTEIGAQLYVAPTPMKRLKLNQKRIETVKDDEELIKLLRQRQEQINSESTRLHFFRSIMPKVDSLTDDEFLEFQVDVLQLLRRKSTVTATFQDQERYQQSSSIYNSHSPRSSIESSSTNHLNPQPTSSIKRETPSPSPSCYQQDQAIAEYQNTHQNTQ